MLKNVKSDDEKKRSYKDCSVCDLQQQRELLLMELNELENKRLCMLVEIDKMHALMSAYKEAFFELSEDNQLHHFKSLFDAR